MTRSIVLYRRHTKRLDARRFAPLAERLGLDAKLERSDDALIAHDGTHALAYAQPCAPFAGLLFYADQTVAWAEPAKRVLPAARARKWAESFLGDAELLPGEVEGGELDFELAAAETEAVVFDGKERRRESVKTDIVSRIQLNGIEVTGPRAKVRMIFKTDERPVLIHAGLWEKLSRYDERELVSEHEVAGAIRERLGDRKDCSSRPSTLVNLRLLYWADEFKGGPDLLAPWYFAEIEHSDPSYAGKEPIQGPRQLLRIPAFR
jgi:hypothetical protein